MEKMLLSFSASEIAFWRIWSKNLSISGPMFIDIESFNESRQASGYGVVLQRFVMEEMSVFKEEVEGDLRADVEERRIVQRRRHCFILEKAITKNAEVEEFVSLKLEEMKLLISYNSLFSGLSNDMYIIFYINNFILLCN